MSNKYILFTTDLSDTSMAAFPVAEALARRHGDSLIIFHVQEPPTAYVAGEWYYGPLEPTHDELKQALANIKPSDPSIQCHRRLGFGEPAQEIANIVEEENVEMIVMSSEGRTGLSRVLIGSVAEKVVRLAHCPVLVVKPKRSKSHPPSNQLEPLKFDRILAATDFSPASRSAIQVAAALSGKEPAELILLHVEQPFVPYGGGEIYSSRLLDAHTETLLKLLEATKSCNPHIAIRTTFAIGDPAKEIVKLAKREDVDLIVIGTEGRTGLPHFFLGSVAEKVVHKAECPVLVGKRGSSEICCNPLESSAKTILGTC